MGYYYKDVYTKDVKNSEHTNKEKNTDYAKIRLGPLTMELKKSYKCDTPHELSMYVPRAEVRETTTDSCKSMEIIYSSITIVDAPRHESEFRNEQQEE